MAKPIPVSLRDDSSRSYAFIDANYLRSDFARHMHEFYGVVPEVDFSKVQELLGSTRTYYYDAVNYQTGPGETDADASTRIKAREAEHKYISSLPGFHVRNGFVRRGDRRNSEQKAVDVQLAVDALEHAARGNMSVASILTGDLDFEPLLPSLERLGVRTRLFHVRSSAAPALLEAADERHVLTLEDFFKVSPNSFRANYKPLKIHPQTDMRNAGTRPIRNGRWRGRAVTLYIVQDDTPRLHVAWGHELTEPSFTMEYPDRDRLLKAFELTYGDVDWTGDYEAWYVTNFMR